jgi:hypothetical protein
MVVPVQALEAKKSGENRQSEEARPTSHGLEVVAFRLPRKALNTITPECLYPKPTQVGG